MTEAMQEPTWTALGEAQTQLNRTAWALTKAKQAHAEANARYVEAHTAHFGHPPKPDGFLRARPET